MAFTKISIEILRANDAIFSYFEYASIDKSRKGDDVFVGGSGVAPDAFRQLGGDSERISFSVQLEQERLFPQMIRLNHSSSPAV